jgi:hypothetical protein
MGGRRKKKKGKNFQFTELIIISPGQLKSRAF